MMTSGKANSSYALVTAARNEEAFIQGTLEAVASQSTKPLLWIIVSDASTDRTDAIVQDYATRYEFIQLLRLDGKHERNFAAQVEAINAGYDRLRGLEYGFMGNLDADISFDSDYFSRLLEKFSEDRRLGLAGGWIYEDGHAGFQERPGNKCWAVPHAIQLFRRECYEEIGGYVALPFGGPDWLAEIMTRMKGWQVRSFPDLPVYHHRTTGTATNLLHYMFTQGLISHSVGSDPLFEFLGCISRIPSHPMRALCKFAGFSWGYCKGMDRPVSPEVLGFLRKEQRARIRSALRRPW